MRKLLLLFISISFLVACDNEPLDRDVLNDNTNDNNGPVNTSDDPLALDLYILDISSTIPIFGTTIINSEFSFNSNNRVNNTLVATTFFGQSFSENVLYMRDNLNRIIGYTSSNSGVVTNETTIAYSGDKISQIVYNFIEDDSEDYTYNFSYFGNIITRTEVGSSIYTEFTLDGNDRLIRKESFDNTTSIKTEVLDYDGLGNCITSIITGEDASSSTFVFDANNSPLIEAFSDQYLLIFLNDDYSDNVGGSLAQFASPNNWIGIVTPESTVNFTVEYDTDNRITSRSGNYDS